MATSGTDPHLLLDKKFLVLALERRKGGPAGPTAQELVDHIFPNALRTFLSPHYAWGRGSYVVAEAWPHRDIPGAYWMRLRGHRKCPEIATYTAIVLTDSKGTRRGAVHVLHGEGKGDEVALCGRTLRSGYWAVLGPGRVHPTNCPICKERLSKS